MRDISKSSSASRPPWRRLVLATALTCGCSGVALAFLPTIVHDPKLDASLTAWYARMESSAAAHHFRQLTELINQVNAQREQIQQFADWRGYMERIQDSAPRLSPNQERPDRNHRPRDHRLGRR